VRTASDEGCASSPEPKPVALGAGVIPVPRGADGVESTPPTVVTAIVSVTTKPPEERAGQSVTEATQPVIVRIWVLKRVKVADSPELVEVEFK